MSLRCIKCDGAIGPRPDGDGFHCGICGSAFLDFGRVTPEKDQDLAQHPSEPTSYRCPVDREPLRRHRLNGLEFERCPACRHLWLDEGEISILRRMASDRKPPPSGKQDGLLDRMDEEGAWDLVGLFFEVIGAVGDW